jgi:hypothetical protein
VEDRAALGELAAEEAAAFAVLPLPPALERLARLFPAVNALHGFLTGQHMQVGGKWGAGGGLQAAGAL